MCHHENVLEDYERGDLVCTCCGLVLDRIIGVAGGVVGKLTRSSLFYNEDGNGINERDRDDILTILGVFHLDNHSVIDSVFENYSKIYASRTSGNGFRRSEAKRQIAIAFSICNTMAKMKISRPGCYVTDLCRVSPSALLDLPTTLCLSKRELEGMRREDYELQEAMAEDYVDVVCSHLGIPFHLATDIREKVQAVQWRLYGRRPNVIVAAAIQTVLVKEKGWESKFEFVCQQLNCQPRTVRELMTCM